jgi:pimeloyl-ACP methyl ester carboxylesterase
MGSFVDVNGVHTYFEEDGEGDVVVLLHGGLASVETWSLQRPALATKYRVVIPERRGHGRTPDVGELTYDLMADDTVAFIEALGLAPCHLVGFSDGGAVAMRVAIRRDDLVRKLVVLGTPAGKEGEPEYWREVVGVLTPDSPPLMVLKGLYESLSPDGPEHWPIVCNKVIDLWRQSTSLGLDALRGIKATTLILLGDDDGLTPEHAAAMARSVQDGYLGIVPGASHNVAFERPEIINRILLEFLDEAQPYPLFSISKGITFGRWWE